MKTGKVASFLVVLALTLPAVPALAQDPAETIVAAPKPRDNSVNVSPLGIAIGAYTVNYERLFGGYHGLVVEGGLAFSSGDGAESTSYGGALGYRWHWSGEQDSGFLGFNVGYYRGAGSGSITTNGMTETFDVDTQSLFAVANIGKRWAWDNGFNITFRIGGGYARYDVSTSSTDPDAQGVVETVENLLEIFPIAIDGELSVGYTF
jgi:hypothetical protein